MRLGFLILAGVITIAPAHSLAEEQSTSVVEIDGHHWFCQSSQGAYYCIDNDTGEIYESQLPLSEHTLKIYRQTQERETDQAACACSRQIDEGGYSGTRILCTGAFSPYVLRKRTTDPCAGAWEKKQ